MSDTVDPRRYLPHAVLATAVVMVLPAVAVSAVASPRDVMSVPIGALVVLLSLALTRVCSAFWMRRPVSRDLVFGDLLLWGWLRRVRAERRLAEAAHLLRAGRRTPGDAPRIAALRQLGEQLEARDRYTHGHTRRVTRHAERIARQMGLSAYAVAKVRTAAAVHDVGKVLTPREVLTKPGRLTDEELALMRRHPVDGAEMVAGIGDPEIAAMVRHHHERLDGTGYPDGLAGDGIPLGARIIAVADTFDALASARPYRCACSHRKAVEALSREAGSQLDPVAVSAFLDYYSGKRAVGWLSFLTAVPQRVATWFGWVPTGAGVAAAPFAQSTCAAGAFALLGACLVGGPVMGDGPTTPVTDPVARTPEVRAGDSVPTTGRTVTSIESTPRGRAPGASEPPRIQVQIPPSSVSDPGGGVQSPPQVSPRARTTPPDPDLDPRLSRDVRRSPAVVVRPDAPKPAPSRGPEPARAVSTDLETSPAYSDAGASAAETVAPPTSREDPAQGSARALR